MTDLEQQLRVQLGQALRKARLVKNLTQSDLAELVNTDPETISRFERGATLPSLVRLLSLADALNVSLSTVLIEASPRPTDEQERLTQALVALPDRDRRLVVAMLEAAVKARTEG